jgi:hypothetical protein
MAAYISDCGSLIPVEMDRGAVSARRAKKTDHPSSSGPVVPDPRLPNRDEFTDPTPANGVGASKDCRDGARGATFGHPQCVSSSRLDDISFDAEYDQRPQRLNRIASIRGRHAPFGNPGTTELPIMHALADYPDMRYVLGPQEAIVVAMADGYVRASGELVACNVHVAPGLDNAKCRLPTIRRAATIEKWRCSSWSSVCPEHDEQRRSR